MPCILVDSYWRFGQTYRLNLQGWSIKTLNMETVCFSKTLISTYGLHGIKTQNIVILIAVRTSNLTTLSQATAVFFLSIHRFMLLADSDLELNSKLWIPGQGIGPFQGLYQQRTISNTKVQPCMWQDLNTWSQCVWLVKHCAATVILRSISRQSF
jgi:hypothetical protein